MVVDTVGSVRARYISIIINYSKAEVFRCEMFPRRRTRQGRQMCKSVARIDKRRRWLSNLSEMESLANPDPSKLRRPC